MNLTNSALDPLRHHPNRDLEGYGVLAELALNMRWSWNHSTDEVWRQLDPELWEITQNPWAVLQTASRDQIGRLLADPAFREDTEALLKLRRQRLADPVWFQHTHQKSPLTCAAYFSMEYMLSEALPIYSGGLGNVAGDQLKASSDLGVPVVGVGLLYQQGYFRQVIDKDGTQQALYPYNDPGQLPIAPVRQANGEWLRLKIELPGSSIWIRVWQAQVGRLNLYLLDSNDAANLPAVRGITSELYGGGPELRLQQEMLLGIAGWRLLGELGIEPEVCHLNEGHAAFAILERSREYMEKTGESFEAALAVTRAGNLFTTHTAVAAGFDQFQPALIERYLGHYAEQKLGISLQDLLALGRKDRNDPNESFNMAYLAVRGSGAVNGVSRLHEEVSHQIFLPLFPRWPKNEIPVGHVTNGIHVPTWDSASSTDLWESTCGDNRWEGAENEPEANIRNVTDEQLWQLRADATSTLVKYTRTRLSRELTASGASAEDAELVKHIFSNDILTLGFARRFATYKRPNLLLHDPDRLLSLLTNPERPVQLIIAGKAHPEDLAGQELIHQWIRFIRQPQVRPHVAFLSDYDMTLTQHLVQGVDVWINTPQRPWEASGTSGMKVLANGGINLSELDGWWAEAYTPEVGWALGDGQEHGDDPDWDAIEANALYDLLEQKVVPEFYGRDESGIPRAWVARMRESMARLTPLYSADRSVREYTEKYYIPGATAFRMRTKNSGTMGRQIVEWHRDLETNWPRLTYGQPKRESRDGQLHFEIDICLNEMSPSSVRVELYADGEDGGAPFCSEMTPVGQPTGPNHEQRYAIAISSSRSMLDYTPRLIPRFEGVLVPIEASNILWCG